MTTATVFESLYQEELYQVQPKVLFIISQPWETLSENERSTLIKMMTALKLNPASVQIIHLNSFSTEDLAAYSPTKVIALGATLTSSSRLYENFSVNHISVVVADALPQLDDAKKKNLWLALRQMFGL